MLNNHQRALSKKLAQRLSDGSLKDQRDVLDITDDSNDYDKSIREFVEGSGTTVEDMRSPASLRLCSLYLLQRGDAQTDQVPLISESNMPQQLLKYST